jgi:hypothetical protein
MERGENFELTTNVTNAGNFNDLVYTAGGRRYCLQLKHTENPKEKYLQPKELVKILHECFQKYFREEHIDNSEFIIYTNKSLGTLKRQAIKKSKETRVDRIFRTTNEVEIFSLIPHSDKKIDIYSRVVDKMEENKILSDEEKNEVNKFLYKVIMVTGQKGQHELDYVISEEIRKHDAVNFGPEVNKTKFLHFKTETETWWRNRNKPMTPETLKNWLQEAKSKACAPVVRSLFKSCTKKLGETGIKFSDSEIKWLQAKLSGNELSDKRAVLLRSDALTLCSILLLDCLDISKCIFVTFGSLQSNKNMLLHAWLEGHWEWLIVFCDSAVQQSDISDKCCEIFNRAHSSKRAIILTACSDRQISDFHCIEHKFEFEQLSEKSKERVLDEKVDFQICEK